MRWFVLILGLVCAGAQAQERIVVERAAPDVKRVTFNSMAPPNDMPKLTAGESAYCGFRFECELDWGYRTSQRSTSSSGTWQVTVVPETGKARLRMNVTVWLPVLASARLVAHEEGHQRIAERVYGEAEKTVRKAMFDSLGRGMKGEGASEENAVQAALDALNAKVLESYLKNTADRTQRLSDVYDELTDHGRKKFPAVDEAIESAFEREMVRTGKAPVSR